ncbi:class II aldolase/adducin family protein [Oculatella sp. LEGE 06141]|uniref:class II aldolase/adducin family protein n=1 Tax=Oculatella sp. LEGE 06141 TaxID=1828648 RepID=UPI001882A712|nr:class II aldolase/adducin family protein [Oculatella sp. LEGE 06141]MBE9178945.1 class II aldolase/adducin family protein [Oculatella sp. LEGE 06141]
MVQKIDLALQSYSPEVELSLSERELRIQLAAAYRLIDKFQMSDLIYTHISVRLPGPENHFLINPYGLLFREVTASSLVKVDLDGNIVGESEWPVNPAGFVIHSAIHSAREDLFCVVHTHTRYGMAVSALECGLLPISQFALQFYNRVAYHDYEGVSLDLDERSRLVNDLGDKKVMIMRNHGLLTAGRTIPEAFSLMFYLNRSCEVQITAQSSGAPLIIPSPDVCEHSAAQQNIDDVNFGQLEWSALIRMLDREDSSYRH